MTLKNLHTGGKSQTRCYGLNNEPSPIFYIHFHSKESLSSQNTLELCDNPSSSQGSRGTGTFSFLGRFLLPHTISYTYRGILQIYRAGKPVISHLSDIKEN